VPVPCLVKPPPVPKRMPAKVVEELSPPTINVFEPSETSELATPASEAMSRRGVSALVAPRPGVAWSAAGDYTQLRIFRSGDGGATWQDFRKNLRADVIYELAADPVTRRIYAATSSGVWALEDDEQ